MSERIVIYLCENFMPEFRRAVELEGFDDVFLREFPCVCMHPDKKQEMEDRFRADKGMNETVILLCGKSCKATNYLENIEEVTVKHTNYCYDYVANENIIQYMMDKGSFLVSLNWLEHWKENLEKQQMSKDEIRAYYAQRYGEIVFFNVGMGTDVENRLRDLSEYLQLPHTIIPFELDYIRMLLRSVVYEWRLQKLKKKHRSQVQKLQTKCAEYVASYDIVAKIIRSETRESAFDRATEVFTLLLGAKKVMFHFAHQFEDSHNKEVRAMLNNDENFMNRGEAIYVKISHRDITFGVIEVSEFDQPEQIGRHINIALEIANVLALVLDNLQR